MRGAQLLAALSQDLLDLRGAARIGAGEQIRVRGEDVHDLPGTDLVGAFRLGQVSFSRQRNAAEIRSLTPTCTEFDFWVRDPTAIPNRTRAARRK